MKRFIFFAFFVFMGLQIQCTQKPTPVTNANPSTEVKSLQLVAASQFSSSSKPSSNKTPTSQPPSSLPDNQTAQRPLPFLLTDVDSSEETCRAKNTGKTMAAKEIFLPAHCRAIFDMSRAEAGYTQVDPRTYPDEVFIINNKEEFQKLVSCSEELAIDFSLGDILIHFAPFTSSFGYQKTTLKEKKGHLSLVHTYNQKCGGKPKLEIKVKLYQLTKSPTNVSVLRCQNPKDPCGKRCERCKRRP